MMSVTETYAGSQRIQVPVLRTLPVERASSVSLTDVGSLELFRRSNFLVHRTPNLASWEPSDDQSSAQQAAKLDQHSWILSIQRDFWATAEMSFCLTEMYRALMNGLF
jgi:hypothetical protein